MAAASPPERRLRSLHWVTVTDWCSRVFQPNREGLNWPRGVLFLDVVLVPLVVFWAIGHEQYLLSAVFAVLLVGAADVGGSYQSRVLRLAVFTAIGAGVTALGFTIGRTAWGWMVLVAFVVSLVAGLALRFGVHGFVAGLLLNVWFILALSYSSEFQQHAHLTNYIWAQVCAWVGGSALWILLTFVAWLIRGRPDLPPPVPELPGDTTPRKLTRAQVVFAVIRAVAIAGSVAIGFGLNLSYGRWVAIATVVALKPSLEQSTLIGLQRVAGALIGAGAAMLLLLIPANENGLKLLSIDHGLEVVAIIVLMHAIAVRFWNYALYYGAISAAVLILEDLAQPTNYSAEGERVLWTLCGVGIAVLVMLLAGLLAKRGTKSTSPSAPQPVSQRA